MSSFGLDRFTGKPISGWAHVLQSVDVIFETEIGDRVMLRHFGGGMRRLLGRRLTQRVLALAASVFALSIAIWEPRLRVVRVGIAPSAEEIRQGTVSFVMEVVYRPNGHRGDFTEEPASRLVGVGVNDNGVLATMEYAA
nr:GPW/gp25 family protein [Methylobacterium sp. OTU13CASTA1]